MFVETAVRLGSAVADVTTDQNFKTSQHTGARAAHLVAIVSQDRSPLFERSAERRPLCERSAWQVQNAHRERAMCILPSVAVVTAWAHAMKGQGMQWHSEGKRSQASGLNIEGNVPRPPFKLLFERSAWPALPA